MRLILYLSLLFAVPAMAQHHDHHAPSPYAAEADRPIKALSAAEIDDLTHGRGMGLARAAELNGYPGPKHVLDLADALMLTAEQRSRAERLMAQVQTDARSLGAQIVELERHLDALFADGEATAEAVDRMMEHLGTLRGQLRAVHLRAHIAMRAALTPAQVEIYEQLRGYSD